MVHRVLVRTLQGEVLNRRKSHRALPPSRITQIRLGITLGRLYLEPKGKGKLRTLTEKEYNYLCTLTDVARAEGSATHAAYWHTIKDFHANPAQLRRYVEMYNLGADKHILFL